MVDTNKVVAITGASSGIGRATAQLLSMATQWCSARDVSMPLRRWRPS